MKIVIGIDVGGSTTKICGFNEDMKLINTFTVKSSDPVASVYGAFGKFSTESGIQISSVEKVLVTGVGAKYINGDIYGISTEKVNEFDCIGIGGRYLASLERALVVSVGTGTAIVYSDENKSSYLGGTGVGGGTIVGLSKAMNGVSGVENIAALAKNGKISNVNLLISDITENNYSKTLSPETTASNFGKVSDLTTREDLSLGILNLVFETIGMMSVFAAQANSVKDIVMIGHIPELIEAKKSFNEIGNMFGLRFIIPENSQYGTVIGASLLHFR